MNVWEIVKMVARQAVRDYFAPLRWVWGHMTKLWMGRREPELIPCLPPAATFTVPQGVTGLHVSMYGGGGGGASGGVFHVGGGAGGNVSVSPQQPLHIDEMRNYVLLLRMQNEINAGRARGFSADVLDELDSILNPTDGDVSGKP